MVIATGDEGEQHARAEQVVDAEEQDGADAGGNRKDDVGAAHVDDQAVRCG
jgi:hypothetical protein